MQANSLDGSPSASFLTLFICLQCSDNHFGGSNVSEDVLYVPEAIVDLIGVVFSRELSVIPSAIKNLLEVISV